MAWPRGVRWVAGCGLVLGALVWSAPAQGLRDLVEAALDQRITERVEISERPVRDVLFELEQRTGLHFLLDDLAVEWLPYG